MRQAQEGIDFCRFCSVTPRHPCRDQEETRDCPNHHEYYKHEEDRETDDNT